MDNGWVDADFDSVLFDEMVQEMEQEKKRKKTLEMMREGAKAEQKAFDEVKQIRTDLKSMLEVFLVRKLLHITVYFLSFWAEWTFVKKERKYYELSLKDSKMGNHGVQTRWKELMNFWWLNLRLNMWSLTGERSLVKTIIESKFKFWWFNWSITKNFFLLHREQIKKLLFHENKCGEQKNFVPLTNISSNLLQFEEKSSTPQTLV